MKVPTSGSTTIENMLPYYNHVFAMEAKFLEESLVWIITLYCCIERFSELKLMIKMDVFRDLMLQWSLLRNTKYFRVISLYKSIFTMKVKWNDQ